MHAVPPCYGTAAAYPPAMALPVLPLLAAGLLGYVGYRVAKTAVATAERERRRRDWFAVQDPEAVAAGKEAVAHGGAGLPDRRAWLKGNVLSTSYEFEDGAVRFEHQGGRAPLRRALRLGRAGDVGPGGADAVGPAGGSAKARRSSASNVRVAAEASRGLRYRVVGRLPPLRALPPGGAGGRRGLGRQKALLDIGRIRRAAA